MKKWLILLFALPILFVASSLPVATEMVPQADPVRPDTSLQANALSPLVERYFAELTTQTRFNGALLVSHQGQVIFRKAHGFRRIGTGEPLATDDIFQIASVSKQFTALAVALLHQQGKIDYQQPVNTYLPDFPFADMTVHQLLCHRTGLQNYMYFAEHHTDRQTPLSNQAMYRLLVEKPNQLKPYWPAGQGFNYSNTGYAVLALLVEKVSGVGFSEFLHQNFFAPAGMRSTYLLGDSLPSNRLVRGHFPNGSSVPYLYQDNVLGDKSVLSTVDDLFRWDRFLASNQVLDTTLLEAAFRNHSPNRNPARGYGYGWRLWFYPDGRKIEYHTGWYRGYTALFVRIRATNSSIVILSNRVNRSFMRSFHQLVDVLTAQQVPASLPTTLPLDTDTLMVGGTE